LLFLVDKTVFICKTTTYDKIHKISFRKICDNSYQVACAAGREILHVNIVDNKFEGGGPISKFSDWISSIYIFSDGSLTFLTSHNLSAVLSINDQKVVIKEKLGCEEKSTLYCSFIHGDGDQLLMFAGTALGELVVHSRKKENNKEAQIIYRKSLHSGVIFCIDYNGSYLVI
jgi:hypothetical protein